MYWKGHDSGQCVSKSAYVFIALNDNLHLNTNLQRACKILWHLPIMPKWKFFMWKLLYDRIATKEQLHKRGIVLTTNCDLCPASMEIVKHLCNECNMAIMLGKMILLLLASFSMLQFLFMVRLSHTSCGFIARINTIMHVSSSSLSYYGVCDYIKMNVYLRYCPGFL